MTQLQFDEHVTATYPALREIAHKRYGVNGDDILHDALVSIYSSQAYQKLPSELKASSIIGWITEATVFAMRGMYRAETKLKRAALLSYRDQVEIITACRREQDVPAPEEPTDLIIDVRNAVARLPVDNRKLARCLLRGETIREYAKRTAQSFYTVFTQAEITKAMLRTPLMEYAPWSWKRKEAFHRKYIA